ncbi:MAG TPA: universal stress protein, partial [Mycobacterium sp.]|nr:universal stress protein [Mycobacterium sp.]
MSGYRTVIVGTDGSASSLRAVDRAGAFAANENA